MAHQVLLEIFGLEEFLFTEVTGIGSLRVVARPMVLQSIQNKLQLSQIYNDNFSGSLNPPK